MAVITGSSFSPRLERLKIKAFADQDRTGLTKTFLVMFNPETYSLSYKNNFSDNQALGGTKGRRLDFMSSEPSRFSLKLILDSTDVTGKSLKSFTGLPKQVHDSVEEFLQLTVATKSKEEPSYLTLVWGALNLNCRLSEVTVNYTLFDKQGNPLRAELDTTFIEDRETRLKSALNQAQVSGPSVQISSLAG